MGCAKITKRKFYIFLVAIATSYLGYLVLAKIFLHLSPYAPVPIRAFTKRNRSQTKMILTWTPFFGKPMTNDYLNGCPFRNVCFISTKHSDYKDADAFVYHATDMDLRNLPPEKSPAQLYVLLSHESPPHTHAKAYELSNFFNWTMTYRLDSDVPYPYSYIVKAAVSLSVHPSIEALALSDEQASACDIITEIRGIV